MGTIKSKNLERHSINNALAETDAFFKQFSELDSQVYSDGVIPKKYKELTGLSISILTRCDECVLYHLQECLAEKANKEEILDAIKIGVIGGGSITYPTARYAFSMMKELKIIE